MRRRGVKDGAEDTISGPTSAVLLSRIYTDCMYIENYPDVGCRGQ